MKISGFKRMYGSSPHSITWDEVFSNLHIVFINAFLIALVALFVFRNVDKQEKDGEKGKKGRKK